jgi:hypothetical protein
LHLLADDPHLLFGFRSPAPRNFKFYNPLSSECALHESKGEQQASYQNKSPQFPVLHTSSSSTFLSNYNLEFLQVQQILVGPVSFALPEQTF